MSKLFFRVLPLLFAFSIYTNSMNGEISMKSTLPCFKWISQGDVRLDEGLRVNNPVYIYVAKGGARWNISGSIAGVECLLKAEIKNSQPPGELVDMLATLFPTSSSRLIDAFLIREYKRAAADAQWAGSPVERTIHLLEPYLSKSGCTQIDQRWIVRYYFFQSTGAVQECQFAFDRDWSLREIKFQDVDQLKDVQYLAPMY